MKIICTICMRANSQEVKNKNLKIINKKPLMYFTIKSAIKSKLFDKIVVSSDSKKIQSLSKKFGAEVIFTRPKRLSSKYIPKLNVIKHAVLESEKHFNHKFNYVVDLDVTAPCRDANDVKKAFKKFKKSKKNMLVSVAKSKKNPYFNMLEIKKGQISLVKKNSRKIFSRQQSPTVYDMNAAIYIWKRNKLLQSKNLLQKSLSIYEMPQEKSIDIDTELDFRINEMIIKKFNLN
ncbi:acylneuraminate cytidylyltransferase family protein [Candidatus Pelagibacter sp.]|nr:acylneuraminate cytidylyltransferase family protein [Candidatus Pelagibacter sp.]